MTRLLVRCLLAAAVPGLAQTPAGVHTLQGITFQATLRSRVEAWDWFQADSGNNAYGFSGNILRLSAAKTSTGRDWQAEFAVPFLLGLPSTAVATGVQGQLGQGASYYIGSQQNQNTAIIFPKQIFVRFKNLADVKGSSLRIGRFEFADGAEHSTRSTTLTALKRDHIAQRLIGPFAFTHMGRSFDGIQYSIERPANNFTFVGAVPTRGVFQADGWGWNRIAFGYGAYSHEWGRGRHVAETRVFMVEYDDWRHIVKTDNRPLAVRRGDTANIRIETFGGHSLHAIETGAGTVDFLAWGAVQAGRWGTQRHRASSFDGEVGLQPKALPKLKPWLRAGYTMGSGSSDPNGKEHGTFFQLLPTPRIYARFPFFNMMNTEDRFGSLMLRPHAKLTVTSEFHSLRLAESNDLWYLGGGAFQAWTVGYVGRSGGGTRSLSNLYDTQADYRLSRLVSLTVYAGYAQGMAVMGSIYPHGKDAWFGYAEFTYRF